MAQAISVRLDEDAMRALRLIQATGLSRSDAIRVALEEKAARLRTRESLRAESAALEANEADRAEMLAIAALMEQLRGPR
ncbi:MAG: ribbon-helix-helix protein, CopG family [Acidimicrobiales bacterium]|nr:ribbon-helix-helix protein, CopG family [Acidimicrobiales bacterium]